MIVLTNSAEGQVNGTAISSGSNTGSGSGDVFAASKTATATLQFSSTQKARGSISYFFSFTAASESAYLQWTPTGETATSYAIRGYLWIAANPAANDQFIASFRNSSANVLSIAVSTAGKLKVLDAVGSTIYTSTTAVSASTWTRFECVLTRGTTTSNGAVKFKFFVGDSTTSVDTEFASSTVNAGTTDLAGVRFGRGSALSSTWSYYLDDLALQTAVTSYIGPTTQTAAATTATSNIDIAAAGQVGAVSSAAVGVGIGITATGSVAAGATGLSTTGAVTVGVGIVAGGVVDHPATGNISLGIGIVATAVVGKASTGSISLGTALSATAATVAGLTTSAAVSPAIAITASGVVGRPTSAPLAVGVSIVATGVVGTAKTAPLSVGIAIAATGVVARVGSADIGSSIELTAAGVIGALAAGAVTAGIDIDADGFVAMAVDVDLDLGISITAVGIVATVVTPDAPLDRVLVATVQNRTVAASVVDQFQATTAERTLTVETT